MKLPETGGERKGREVEYQSKKLKEGGKYRTYHKKYKK